jgi:hypothetical protein
MTPLKAEAGGRALARSHSLHVYRFLGENLSTRDLMGWAGGLLHGRSTNIKEINELYEGARLI